MKYCTKCGAQNEDYALVCTQCQSQFSRAVNQHAVKRTDVNTIFYLLGFFNGIISIVLGFITFFKSSFSKDVERKILSQMGETDDVDLFFEMFLTPSKAFSFGMGSLLVVIGLFLVLYFVYKLISQKNIKDKKENV